MSLKNLLKPPQEAIVEIEESYLRFIVPTGDSHIVSNVNVNQTDILSIFRQSLSRQLGDVRQLSIVTNLQTGVKILPFPRSMDFSERIAHLQLKREEYFGVKNECEFILRPTPKSTGETDEILVSYLNRSFFNRLKQICDEEGFILNRVTNFTEAMIGAYHKQTQGKPEELVCLLNIGFCNINMVILKKGLPIAVRTSLAGSLKEIETRLISVLKLNRSEVDDLLSGKAKADQESIEIIQQNERELLSRISPFFAYLRSIESDIKALKIYLCMPYISLPGLNGLLEQNFRAKVEKLEISNSKGFTNSANAADISWLFGSTERQSLSFSEPRAALMRFSITPRLAWMFILFFLLAPLGLARLSVMSTKNQLVELHGRYSQVENIYQQSKKNRENFAKLEGIGKMVSAQISSGSTISGILQRTLALFNSEIRLESCKFDMARRQMALAGIAIDNEAALRLWEELEKFPDFAQVKINFLDKNELSFPKFAITAELEAR